MLQEKMNKLMLKPLLLLSSLILSVHAYAQNPQLKKIEKLPVKNELSKECQQDAPDVFEAKTFTLSTSKFNLKTYSCQTQKNDRDLYYSTYGLLSSQKAIYLQDRLFEAIGYVGTKATQVDRETVAFDSMEERGGDLVLVWVQDVNHVYALKIPYMASEGGGVKLTAKNDLIYLQKVEAAKVVNDKVIYRNSGQAVIFKKLKNKGLVFDSGDLKALQNR